MVAMRAWHRFDISGGEATEHGPRAWPVRRAVAQNKYRFGSVARVGGSKECGRFRSLAASVHGRTKSGNLIVRRNTN